MPDKSQNITINYKFNTADVDKANQSLNRANQASNSLQASASKAGSTISQEFQRSRKTILDMQTALTRLKSIIEVTSNPAKLKQLTNEYKNLKTQLDAATKSAFGLDKAVQSQGTSAQGLASKFGGVLTAVKAVFGAAVIRQVADMTIEMARLAGNAEGVERAFKRAFPDSVELLANLQKATHGTVSEFELMQRTLQATNLGVAVEQLPILFEFAAARAQQTGESVDYLVDSIVRGIGRKSPLILDNLGLSAVRLKEKFDGVALASLSVAEVTRGVADIARDELGKMGGYLETATTQVDQFGTSWTRLKLEVSKAFTGEGGIITHLKGFVDSFGTLFEAMNKGLSVQELSIEKQRLEIAMISANEFATRVLTGTKEQNIKAIETEIAMLTKSIGSWALFRDGQNELIEELKLQKKELNDRVKLHEISSFHASKELVQLEDQIQLNGRLRDSKKEDVLIDQEILRLLIARLAALKKVKEEETEAEPTGIIERKKKQIEDLQKAIQKTNNMADLGATRLNKAGEVIQGRLVIALEIAQAELADLQRGFTDFKIVEFKTEIDNATETLSNFDEASERIRKNLLDIAENGIVLAPAKPPDSVYTPDTWEMIKDDFVDHWREITSAGIDIQADQLKSLAETELDTMKLRLNNLRDFYDNQQSLAGNNERAKEQLRMREERETTKLRNEIARKEKQVRKTQVIIDIAAGIAKAFATYAWPYSLIPAALVAAQGASQLAIINRQPTNFAKGVIGIKGPGSETSDSIPVNVSRNESIMTGWETRHAGDVLKEIRAKKLDNKVLRELKQGRSPVHQQTVDTAGIIKAIKEQKHPDIVKASNIVYESKVYNDEYRKRIRSSSMSI